jgi:hypothetical protein
MTPQALTRIEGTVLAIRTETIEALPATETQQARPASSYRVADVASKHVRYNDQLVQGLTAVTTVVLGDDDLADTDYAGQSIDALVSPYSTARRVRGQWMRIVQHRFVAHTPQLARSAA